MGRSGACRKAAAPFQGFGKSDFWPFPLRQRGLIVVQDNAEVRGAVRAACPSRPGVYGVVDQAGRLVYVGMSAALRKRLMTYFQGGSTFRKERCIAAHADRLVWEVSGHEFTAQLRELELIRRHQPRFNVKGRQPVRPPGFVYLSREDAPRFRVARQVPKSVRYSWGPLPINWRIREAIELVNRLFKLCDCPASVPMHFAEQRQLFSLDLRLQCLRGEMGTCLGPCAGNCTFTQYAAQLRAARAFLDGRDMKTLQQLERQLSEAAQMQQYERAARLRDTLERLQFLCGQLAVLREPPLPEQFVYPLNIRSRRIWYLAAVGHVVGAVPQPTSSDDMEHCLTILAEAFDRPRAERSPADPLASQIVSSWFRSHPAETRAIFSPTEARQFCRSLKAG
jgi:excinuclease ABC subunit C